jgi:hypothetical protein
MAPSAAASGVRAGHQQAADHPYQDEEDQEREQQAGLHQQPEAQRYRYCDCQGR